MAVADALLAILCMVALVTLALVAVAGVALAHLWTEIHKPPPEIIVQGGAVEDEARNEARATSPEMFVEPSDYILPPWHNNPYVDDMVIPGSDGNLIDITGSIDQIPTDTNMDEPTVLPDGTWILHGEVIHQPKE